MTDWTDFRRSNPELEATRNRWNARYCNAVSANESPSFRLWFIAVVCVGVLVGMCVLAAQGGAL